MPQAKCPEHGERSCLSSGFFAELNIKEPAKFVRFAMTYASRMSSTNSQMMAGLADDTVSKYLRVIEEGTDESIKGQIQNGEMMLGGDGNVVEIDEKQLTINKHHRGRSAPNEITIWDGGSQRTCPACCGREAPSRREKGKVPRAALNGPVSKRRRDLRPLPLTTLRLSKAVPDGGC